MPKVKVKQSRRPNPLRMDPTRTASLRRSFERQLTMRFEKLRVKLRALLLDEDALGLDLEKRDTYFSHPVLGRNYLYVNCGGPGSGVPGPCPSVKAALKGFDAQMKASQGGVKAGTLHPKVAEGNVELAKDDLRTIVGSRVETALLKVRRALRASGKGQEFKAVREAVETSLEEFNVALRTRVADVGGETSKEDRFWNRKEVLSKLKKVGENLAWARRRAGLTANERDNWVEQMTLNCGGPGSGVPGPCPAGVSSVDWTQEKSKRFKELVEGGRTSEETTEMLKLMGEERAHRMTVVAVPKQHNTGVKEGKLTKVKITELLWQGERLEEVTPLEDNSTQPILIAKKGKKYRILDGYGRANGLANAKKTSIHAILVSDKDLNEFGDDDDPDFIEAMYKKYAPDFEVGSVGSRILNAGRWQFATDPQKVKEFKAWLRSQIREELTGRSEKELWEAYTRLGLQKGAGRAFDDTRRPQKVAAELSGKSDFYAGTKDEFLRSSFNKPVAVEKVQLLAERSFDELENVTSAMATRMTRDLTDGLVKGASPREIARDLDRDLDIGRNRSLTIARTEIVRAHAEGQLMALEELGVEEVGVAVEWSTAGDDHVCELCQPLEGVVLKIDEAKGMLPRHPNCRCAWIPANVGEDSKDQKDTEASIGRALDISVERDGGFERSRWGGADLEPDEDRPQSQVGNVDYLAEFSKSLGKIKGGS